MIPAGAREQASAIEKLKAYKEFHSISKRGFPEDITRKTEALTACCGADDEKVEPEESFVRVLTQEQLAFFSTPPVAKVAEPIPSPVTLNHRAGYLHPCAPCIPIDGIHTEQQAIICRTLAEKATERLDRMRNAVDQIESAQRALWQCPSDSIPYSSYGFDAVDHLGMPLPNSHQHLGLQPTPPLPGHFHRPLGLRRLDGRYERKAMTPSDVEKLFKIDKPMEQRHRQGPYLSKYQNSPRKDRIEGVDSRLEQERASSVELDMAAVAHIERLSGHAASAIKDIANATKSTPYRYSQ